MNLCLFLLSASVLAIWWKVYSGESVKGVHVTKGTQLSEKAATNDPPEALSVLQIIIKLIDSEESN